MIIDPGYASNRRGSAASAEASVLVDVPCVG